MSDGYARLRAFERARWARQADVLRAWLDALPPIAPRADALRRVFGGTAVVDAAVAQMRFELERDLGRLHSALAGQTPTAVDRARADQSPEAFARHEAVHTVDNAAVFLGRAQEATSVAEAGAAVERAQRWIQRLRWELVDTGIDAEVPVEFSAQAAADPTSAPAVAEETLQRLTRIRASLDP